MNRFTFASLFTGGDGWGVGLRAAGGRGLWGVEYDPAIAAVATRNGATGVIVASVLDVDYAAQPVPDVLVISQPCPSFSGAKTGGAETPADIALAQAGVRAIETLLPRVVLIENVPPYAGSQSARLLQDALWAAGYWVQASVLNAADYGVPQTRKRWILRAVRGGWVPALPPPVPWVGWYAAIADLLDTLPASAFAPWQLKRLTELDGDTLINGINGYARAASDPAHTIQSAPGSSTVALRAFIIGGGNTSDASLEGSWYSHPRPAEAPMFTVSASQGPGQARAFLLSNAATEWGDGRREPSAPAFSVTAQHEGRLRAFLVDCQDSGSTSGLTIRDEADPSFTVTASMWPRRAARAWLDRGRVVRMTPRALARFQSFPDSYVLPERARLACTVIGNAVPPLLAQRLVEGLV